MKQWLEVRQEKPGRRSSERKKARQQSFSAFTKETSALHDQQHVEPRLMQADAGDAVVLEEPLESPRRLV